MTNRFVLVRTVLGFAWRTDRRGTATTLGLSVGENIADATPPLWLKFMVDAVVAGRSGPALGWALVMAGSWLIGAFCRHTKLAVSTKLTDRTAQSLDEEIMRLTASLPRIEHHERPEYLDRLKLLQNDRTLLASYCAAVVSMVSFVVRSGVTMAMLVSLHPTLLFLPAFALGPTIAGARAQRMVAATTERLAERERVLGAIYRAAVGATEAKEIRIFGLADELIERQAAVQHELRRAELRSEWNAGLVRTGGGLLFTVGWIWCVGVVVVRAAQGDAGAGDVALAVSIAGQVSTLTSHGVSLVTGTVNVARVIERYRWLLDYAKTARSGSNAERLPAPSRIVTGIRFDDVSFTYPGTSTAVLDGVSLRIPAGSAVAIVGDNGAGKSTLVKLLCGFYRPTSGTILVDDAPLEMIDPEAWRRAVSADFQDSARLELLVRESVGVGNLDDIADVSAVTAALDRAAATNVVESLPQVLETQLGRMWPRGVELSQGEWQKLGIARALMQEHPLVLVLDEPTSALDAQTEHELFERYARAARQTTAMNGGITVFVSHRFSTVRMANVIVVLSEGKVVEAGSHDELIEAEGLYSELYELQARGYR